MEPGSLVGRRHFPRPQTLELVPRGELPFWDDMALAELTCRRHFEIHFSRVWGFLSPPRNLIRSSLLFPNSVTFPKAISRLSRISLLEVADLLCSSRSAVNVSSNIYGVARQNGTHIFDEGCTN